MAGDAEREFEEFVGAVWPRLRHAAYLMTGNYHDAEDMAQTALSRTYQAWGRVRRDDAHLYARRIMINAIIDRRRRRRLLEVRAEPSRIATNDTGLTAAADRDELLRMLTMLTSRERAVVVLRYYFDLSEEQVAHELGVSRGTVKSTASRALAKLRVADDASTARLTDERRRPW